MKEYYKSLTIRERLILLYVGLSFSALCVTEGSSLIAIAVIVLNFANAARLLRKLPEPPEDD